MPKRNETTSKHVAKSAAKALRDPKASKREKSLAGSALTQKIGRRKIWTAPKPVTMTTVAKLKRLMNAIREYVRSLEALEPRKAKRKA